MTTGSRVAFRADRYGFGVTPEHGFVIRETSNGYIYVYMYAYQGTGNNGMNWGKRDFEERI